MGFDLLFYASECLMKRKMLFFDGDIFLRSTHLRTAYHSFLVPMEECVRFFTVIGREMDNIEDELSCEINKITIESTSFYFSTEIDYVIVQCLRHKCIANMDFSIVYISPSYMRRLHPSERTFLGEVLYQLARFRALYLNMLVLHASAVVYRDEVLLFSGVKGAGKSTQARLWIENSEAWILNYDKPVAKLDGEQVLVSGSPWGGKEDLAINAVRPAKALFFVHQAKDNQVVRLSAAQAYAQAHLNYFVYPLNEDIESRYNEAIIQLVKKVPVYDLYCTDTLEAVEAVRRVLYTEEE